MAAPALIPILKKVAFYVVTDKKLLKTVGGIALGIVIILLMPFIAISSILSGDIQLDTDNIQSNIISNLSLDEISLLQKTEDDMKKIETEMSDADYDSLTIKKAQVLYILALSEYSEQEDFFEDLVDCFSDDQTDEELIDEINETFDCDISYEEFEKIAENLESDDE